MWRTINKSPSRGFSKSRPPAGQHQQKGKSWFFKIVAARIEIRARVGKNPGLEFETKIDRLYGILPGCPCRVCPVIVRFLAGGQVIAHVLWPENMQEGYMICCMAIRPSAIPCVRPPEKYKCVFVKKIMQNEIACVFGRKNSVFAHSK